MPAIRVYSVRPTDGETFARGLLRVGDRAHLPSLAQRPGKPAIVSAVTRRNTSGGITNRKTTNAAINPSSCCRGISSQNSKSSTVRRRCGMRSAATMPTAMRMRRGERRGERSTCVTTAEAHSSQRNHVWPFWPFWAGMEGGALSWTANKQSAVRRPQILHLPGSLTVSTSRSGVCQCVVRSIFARSFPQSSRPIARPDWDYPPRAHVHVLPPRDCERDGGAAPSHCSIVMRNGYEGRAEYYECRTAWARFVHSSQPPPSSAGKGARPRRRHSGWPMGGRWVADGWPTPDGSEGPGST